MRKLKKREKKWILRIALITAAVLCLVWYAILYNGTLVLNAQNYSVTTTRDAYVFKRQAVNIVQTKEKVEFILQEGEKAAASTVLSTSIKISASVYARQMVSAIDLILDSDGFSSVEDFLVLVEEKQRSIEALQRNIAEEKDPALKQNMEKTLTALQDEYSVMQIAVRFVFSDTSYLKDLKQTYVKRLSSKETLDLTLGNLNFPFTGYVYYTLDGYENALSSSVIASVDFEYWDYLDSFRPKTLSTLEGVPIKVVNSGYVYIVFKTDSDTYIKVQNAMYDRKAEVVQDNEFNSDMEYYSFLQRRSDVVFSFPEVEFYDEDGVRHTAYYINAIQSEDFEERLCVFMVKGDVHSFVDKNQTEISIITEGYEAYVLDEHSIVYRGEGQLKKAYVLCREKQGDFCYVPVTVFKTIEGKAILRVEDNREIGLENLEIAKYPRLRFWQKIEVNEQ